MKPLPYFAVAAQQVTTHPIHVLKIEGQFLGNTADRYLQVHDSVVTPAEGAVPIKSWLISQGSAFFQSFPAGELALALGFYICVSTAKGTKTLSTDTMDLQVELTDPEVPTGTTFVGDLTTGVNTLQVWADGAGPKRLISLEIDGTALAQDSWVIITAEAAGGGPTTPLALERFPLAVGKTYLGLNALRFGKQGREMFAIDPGDGVAHNGCYVYILRPPGVLDSLNKGKIKAEFK